MPNMEYRTRGNADPSGKPRVYFTCHPDDFSRYFDQICQDIFKTHDCAIYYTADMTAPFLEQDKPTDLGSHNLFVVPVTFRLLREPNRAMDVDIAYAKAQGIPIAPFMMEPGIDEFYAQPDKFGERQYLNPFSGDLTEISYADKLRKYLEAVLISDETARRIRNAFDAYIFLSYRKKDRRYANELMQRIHKSEHFRDIAIWYDEFLTPGESFRENIERILSDSKLFALLVTPNLLEEPAGKPNFVMGQEYPKAHDSGMPILPAEMEATDKAALSAKFDGLPACADPYNDESFQALLLETLSRVAVERKDHAPEHNFLIGLAYMEGIDMEVDRERGFRLVTDAADGGLPEAMEKLFDMYFNGTGVPLDYRQAQHWAEKLYTNRRETLGEKHPDTIMALHLLAVATGKAGSYPQHAELSAQVYALWAEVLGDAHPNTLTALGNLASACDNLGDHANALKLKEQSYDLHCKVLGEDNSATLTALVHLAIAYGKAGDYAKEAQLEEQAYALRCRVLGEDHPETVRVLGNLAVTYREQKRYDQALSLEERIFHIREQTLPKNHPDLSLSLNNLAVLQDSLGNSGQALLLQQQSYAMRAEVLGKAHPETLVALNNLAEIYGCLQDYETQEALHAKVYHLRSGILGPQHPHTLVSLANLAAACFALGKYPQAKEMQGTVYHARVQQLGEAHPDTITVLNNLVLTLYRLEQYPQAISAQEKLCALRIQTQGELHSDVRDAYHVLACMYGAQNNHPRVLEIRQQLYLLHVQALGEDHPDTLAALDNLAAAHSNLEQYDKAVVLQEKAVEQCCRVLGQTHSDTLFVMSGLVDTYCKLQDYGKVLSTLYRLSLLYWDAGNLQQTASTTETLYAWVCRLQGENHPNAHACAANLADIYTALGDSDRTAYWKSK